MAKAMWTYTDGYSLKMTSKTFEKYNPVTDAAKADLAATKCNQFVCISKTTAKDTVNKGRAADGYMCFIY